MFMLTNYLKNHKNILLQNVINATNIITVIISITYLESYIDRV